SGGEQMPLNVRVFDKTGWANGSLTDVVYIVAFENKMVLMLKAAIYTNTDGILNDDSYDYETVGWPLLHQLGRTLLDYELESERQYAPDLSRFALSYQKRKVDDRPALRDLDN